MRRPPSTHLTQRAALPGLRLGGREHIAEMLEHFVNHAPPTVLPPPYRPPPDQRKVEPNPSEAAPAPATPPQHREAMAPFNRSRSPFPSPFRSMQLSPFRSTDGERVASSLGRFSNHMPTPPGLKK